MSEVLSIVLTSNDPVAAANQFHTTDSKTGKRIALRDYLIHLQRPENAGKEFLTGKSEQFEHLLESITANCE